LKPRPERDRRGAKGEKKGRHEAIHQAMVRRGWLRGRERCGLWHVGFNLRGWGVRKWMVSTSRSTSTSTTISTSTITSYKKYNDKYKLTTPMPSPVALQLRSYGAA
jgi:hypothetical protein